MKSKWTSGDLQPPTVNIFAELKVTKTNLLQVGTAYCYTEFLFVFLLSIFYTITMFDHNKTLYSAVSVASLWNRRSVRERRCFIDISQETSGAGQITMESQPGVNQVSATFLIFQIFCMPFLVSIRTALLGSFEPNAGYIRGQCNMFRLISSPFVYEHFFYINIIMTDQFYVIVEN